MDWAQIVYANSGRKILFVGEILYLSVRNVINSSLVWIATHISRFRYKSVSLIQGLVFLMVKCMYVCLGIDGEKSMFMFGYNY